MYLHAYLQLSIVENNFSSILQANYQPASQVQLSLEYEISECLGQQTSMHLIILANIHLRVSDVHLIVWKYVAIIFRYYTVAMCIKIWVATVQYE